MPRTKEVTIAGVTFRIASLSMKQVEELYPSTPEQVEAARSEKFHEIQARIYKTVCYGLNNVHGLRPEDQERAAQANQLWDRDRILEELDMVLFQGLQHEILVFSGLREPASEEKAKEVEGEKKAAAPVIQ